MTEQVIDQSIMKKSNNIELEQRVETTVELILEGLRMSQIKCKLREKYGNVSARTCNNWFSRARERILKESNQSRESIRAESFGFYRNVIADPKSTMREKLLARERIDKICAIELNKLELTGPQGTSLVLRVEGEFLPQAKGEPEK